MPRPPDWNGHRWRRLSAQVRYEERDCWLCHRPIDQALQWPHPQSFSVDHVLPLHHDGPRYDRDNARAAHLSCNQRRGNHCELCRPTERQPLRTSRTW